MLFNREFQRSQTYRQEHETANGAIHIHQSVLQGVSKIHGTTSVMSFSYVDNTNSLYQHRSRNVVSELRLSKTAE
jgi:hypothetical protein